jgi:inorganic pyrophosphatase
MITYRQASMQDIETIANFGKLLYSADNTTESLRAEATANMKSGKWATFLAFDAETPIGMCEVSLRTDYVEGTESGGIVGYVEGVFVLPEYRNQHIAKSLVATAEAWSVNKGCAEFASDCKLENTDSLRFHLKIGFKEAGRNIHFVKKLPNVETTPISCDTGFWSAIDTLISQSEIVIDRPKGSKHPKYDVTYLLDYGYLKDTASMDGGGIDVWRGSLADCRCDTVICTVDLLKRDSEIKLLIGCTEEEKAVVMRFHNDSEYMKGVMVRRDALWA